MKRTMTILAIAVLAVAFASQLGTSQQAPAVPPVPGAGAAPQGGGGRGQQPAAPVSPLLQNYKAVTAERLKNLKTASGCLFAAPMTDGATALSTKSSAVTWISCN
jgi:hypothetical protein